MPFELKLKLKLKPRAIWTTYSSRRRVLIRVDPLSNMYTSAHYNVYFTGGGHGARPVSISCTSTLPTSASSVLERIHSTQHCHWNHSDTTTGISHDHEMSAHSSASQTLPQPPSILLDLYGLTVTPEEHPSIFDPSRGTTLPTPHSPEAVRRPYVTLTFAQSLDAKIAGAGGTQLALSGKESLVMTHW